MLKTINLEFNYSTTFAFQILLLAFREVIVIEYTIFIKNNFFIYNGYL